MGKLKQMSQKDSRNVDKSKKSTEPKTKISFDAYLSKKGVTKATKEDQPSASLSDNSLKDKDTNKSIVEESINPVKNTVVSDPKPSYQSSSKRLLPLPKLTEDGRVSNVYRGKDSQGK